MRSFLRLVAVIVLALHVACGGGSSSLPPPPSSHAPNIVFILVDDQDMDTLATMSKVKALLIDQGMSFNQHYVSLSLCCPSRISGLRGQFAHNTGIYTNGPPDGGFQTAYATGLEQSTAATWLSSAGYRTALFGKYLNGYPETAPSRTYIPHGWTEWYSPVDGFPYKGFDYTLNENGTEVSYGSADADYMTDVLSAKAADFIRRSVDGHPDQPFFVYIATYSPHSPATPAPRYADTYPDAKAPRTPSFNEADVRDKPTWVQALPLFTTEQIADIDRRYRHRLQSLLGVDDLVQNVIDTLRDTGQLDNTYIFYASDNGFHLGQHRMEAGKMTAFEEDIRVPLLVRGPGVPAGSSTQMLSANVDYAPTFAEIAGAAVPSWVDGRSLLTVMHGQTPSSWRDVLLLEHKRDGPEDGAQAQGTLEPPDMLGRSRGEVGTGATPFSGLRTADGFTYIEYEDGEHELYNNLTDPDQLANSYDSASADQKAKLDGWLGSLRRASGSSLRQAEASAH
jgi:arylsulfatase A-like enzyme